MCSASIKYKASVSMDIMLVRIPCGFRDAALTLYHRCVPEVINLLLHRSFSSCCSSRASAWSTSRVSSSSSSTHVSSYPRLRDPSSKADAVFFHGSLYALTSVVSSLISSTPSLISRVRDAWLLGRLVTWLLGYGL